MMIPYPIQLKHNSIRFYLCILATVLLIMIMGCGGGGGGGGGPQPLVPEEDPDTPPENKLPAASITAPTGTLFNEGENIAFTGTATDEEDGELSGAALVWTSSLDGAIGTGSTLTTGALTPGDHDITLTATDSKDGVHTTDPTQIQIARTRFIKMGGQTTDVADATNAFDGDLETAATITTPDSETIHFKAFIGPAETFIFKIKHGASTESSRLAIQGLNPEDTTWRPVADIGLDTELTVTVRVAAAQNYKDESGYINLRARWEGGGSEDSVGIYELWRADPVYAGPKTSASGVDNANHAFDGNPATGGAISGVWDPASGGPFLQFKTYVDKLSPSALTCSIRHNAIGADQLLVIDVEDLSTDAPDDWKFVRNLVLNTADAGTFSVPDVRNYVDEAGYVSLRARWVSLSSTPSATTPLIYEIAHIHTFVLGPKTTLGDEWEYREGNAVDGNPTTCASLYYFWGEADRQEFIHVQTYVGDASMHRFAIQAALDNPGLVNDLIVDGENQPDKWSEIASLKINDTVSRQEVELSNTRPYVDADGYLNLRVRWVSDSGAQDACIYEVSHLATE